MRWINNISEFSELISRVFTTEVVETLEEENTDLTSFVNDHSACRSITFQVTEECNCACTYCYQGCKTNKYMTKEVAKNIVDLLFDMWYKNKDSGLINQTDTKGIILDFIGGEPLLNIDVIEYTCSYFWDRCIQENHPWRYAWSGSISSNGALYFDPRVQNLLKKFAGHMSYSITVDGPKEIHDACRIYKDGSGGNFKDAYAALLDYKARYDKHPGTKVTIAKENLPYLDTVAKFFFENGVTQISGNVVFEHEWTLEESTQFYYKLKSLADTMLQSDLDLYVSFFSESSFCPIDPNDKEGNRNNCGGTGAMLAFDPDGTAYPCLRYMPTSLGKSCKPIIIGNSIDGVYTTPEAIEIQDSLNQITRRSQSTDECFYCPIAKGCAWCSAWNYQETGTPNKRSVRICNSHKARSLANVYFWNKYFLDSGTLSAFHRYLPDEDALKIISKDELELLDNLEKQAVLKAQEAVK